MSAPRLCTALCGLAVALTCLIQTATSQTPANVVYGWEDPDYNLIENGDLEEEIDDLHFNSKTCIKTVVNRGFTGAKSLRITNRQTAKSGLYTSVFAPNVQKDKAYYMSMYIRLYDPPPTSAENYPYINISLQAKVHFETGKAMIFKTALSKYLLSSTDYTQIGGDFSTNFGRDVTKIELYPFVTPNVDYEIDTLSLMELSLGSNWKDQFREQINNVRKNGVTLTAQIPNSVADPSSLQVKVEMVSDEFLFGNALSAEDFVGTSAKQKAYQQRIKDFNFNSFTFKNAMKWKPLQFKEDKLKYGRIDAVLDALDGLNKTIRCHNVYWTRETNQPQWVRKLEGKEMVKAMKARAKSLVDKYSEDCKEIDVTNEYGQDRYFSEKTHNLNIVRSMYNWTKQYSREDALLCANDYQIIKNDGTMASNQANLVKGLKDKGVPINCLGIQGHMRDLYPSDDDFFPSKIWQRLRIVSQVNVSIAVTEFSVHSQEVSVRAKAMEVIFLVMLANPLVTGITLWGFSGEFLGEGKFADDFYLTEGADFELNELGEKYMALRNEFTTKATFTPSSRQFSEVDYSVFRGLYKLTVTDAGGQELHNQWFRVTKGDNQVDFSW